MFFFFLLFRILSPSVSLPVLWSGTMQGLGLGSDFGAAGIKAQLELKLLGATNGPFP